MIVNENKINILRILWILAFVLLPVSFVRASSPSFSFYPSKGIVKNSENGFTVDVLIDSGEYDITNARMVFSFDPRQVQLKKASKNNSLFEQWPEDESTLDNENGVVMLTGFTQSGSGDLYKTSGDPDVLARLEFDVLDDDETILLEWEFTGSDELFQSSLMANGSPPYNVLTIRPTNAQFRFGTLSQTAIESKHIPFIVGGLLILLSGVLITSKPDSTRKKYGTVVVYGE